MSVPILKLSDTLIVTIQASLTDAELAQLRTDIAERVGKQRVKGLVLDVSALDVLDSYASRTLVGIVKVSNLRGAQAVIVGIQPDVAFAMVQLGLTLEGVDTALDLDEGMALLSQKEEEAAVTAEARVAIRHESDIVAARREGRALGSQLGFSSGELTVIATAISEVARNIVVYAKQGEIEFAIIEHSGKRGLLVVARDEGPGIANLDRAMSDGYSSGGGLGLGLPGTRRLMDEFEIASEVGKGTVVTMKKWAR